MVAAEAEAEAMLAAEAKRESMLAAEAKRESMLASNAEGESILAAKAEGGSILAAKAEGESMLASKAEGGSILAGEADSMLAAEADSMLAKEGRVERRRCRFRDCRCCWESFPSGRVAPGIDYVCPPDPDADAADQHLPAWSLLVGVADGAYSLRVSRLRVARSGRILGRSDDVLEVFHTIPLDKPPRYCFQAGVAPLASDGGSLCVLHHEHDEQPQARQLTLQPQPQAESKESPLPKIEGTTSHCMPISADGHVWALSAFITNGITKLLNVVTRRLVPASGSGRRWELGETFACPIEHGPLAPWRGTLIQGYAVIPDANLILVSFQQYGLFLTFAPDSGIWTRVLTHTDETRSRRYLPIVGRGIYVEKHKAVYMLTQNTIFAYKLTYQNDDHGGTQQLKLDLPVQIDYVCPFNSKQGYGFLTRLAGPRMCSVWISLAQRVPCPCGHLHAIVTTFDLHDTQDLAQGGIKVLHATYRRVDMVPNPPSEQNFCFLQEYEDKGSPVLQQRGEEQEGLTSSQHVEDPSRMLSCCRIVQEMRLELSRPASRQHQVCSTSPVKRARTIKKDLIIICQAGPRSFIYRTGAMDDDVKPLKPCHVAVLGDRDWHFFQNGPKIHAVSSIRTSMFEFSLSKDRKTFERPVSRPRAGPFIMVIRVGQEIIALTETLQVYHQTQFNYRWLRYMADESEVVGRRVVISGYVVVSDDSFIVYDAVTCSCLQFDLGAKRWSVVMPLAAFKEDPATPDVKDLLNGRCVFVDGFIYTCRKGGLAAYELLRLDDCVYLSKPIYLPLSRSAHCVGQDMCLDYAGKDVNSGATLFYVMQGGYSPHKDGVRTTTFSITTVKVKTERTASNKMKPVEIDNMDSITRGINHTGAMRCCFAV